MGRGEKSGNCLTGRTERGKKRLKVEIEGGRRKTDKYLTGQAERGKERQKAEMGG